MSETKLNIILIGNGMYSTGRGTDGFGTIMPAIVETKRMGINIGNVSIVGTDVDNSLTAKNKVNELLSKAGIKVGVSYFPKEKNDTEEYLKVIKKIEKPACAIIAVPDHLHFKIAKDCLENNIHCLLVKPFTTSLSEAKQLTDIALKKILLDLVEFHKRWDRANISIRDSYNAGELGELLYVLVEYSQRKSIPTEIFKSWSSQTNVLNYLGVHYIDLISFITKAKPLKAMSTGQKYFLKEKGIDTYDSVQTSIEWKALSGNTFIQTLLVNWIDPVNSSSLSDQKIKLIGTRGRYESDQKDRGLTLVTDDDPFEVLNPYFSSSFENEEGFLEWTGYGIESVREFLLSVDSLIAEKNSLEKISKHKPTFQESTLSSSVLEAANLSLQKDSIWIDIA